MRSLPKLTLLPCILLALSACAPADPEMETTDPAADPAAETTTTDDAAVREAIEARIDAYEQAALAGDFEATKSLWSDDIEIREPGVRVSGRAELDAFYQEMSGTGMTVEAVDIRIDEVFGHGDVAYTVGDYEETVQPPGDAEPIVLHNHWFGRWERGADGTWTLDRLVVGAVDAPEGMESPQQ